MQNMNDTNVANQNNPKRIMVDMSATLIHHGHIRLLKEAKKACGASLKELFVFDIYEGDKLPAGQKSVALRALFQSSDVALTDADLQRAIFGTRP